MAQKALLALEDGTIITGKPFGACTDAVFELVFNTSMMGYQEIITDPSYRGQGVLFTTSHVGNTGINTEDNESNIPQASAVLVREVSPSPSSWRSLCSISDWLSHYGIPGISGIDTRFLSRKLRDNGVMKAALSTQGTLGPDLVQNARAWPGLDGRDMVREVTGEKLYQFNSDPGCVWINNQTQNEKREFSVVVLDCGVKSNILRYLLSYGLEVNVVPAYTQYEDILSLRPDGILLSNGPGDPAGLPHIVNVVKKICFSGIPVFGICLGHQLIGRAIGGETEKLKFGHHSANHPVLDLHTGKVQITAQNHNYAVVIDSLDPELVQVTHLSLNDRTLEGMSLKKYPVYSVQYHPEASPGPHDGSTLFNRFYQLILHHANKRR